MGTDRLRVAVPGALRAGRRDNGHRHMWATVLERLAERCDLVEAERPPRMRRPHVWLYDGHGPAPEGAGRVRVVQLHEPAVTDDGAAALLDPGFLEALAAHTARSVAEAATVITPSAASRDGIVACHGADPARVVAVPHGVDHAVFRPDARSRAADVLAAHGGDPARPYVLFVSQLHPRKGVDIVRDAMGRLADAGLPHQLVLVGGPPADRPDGDAVAERYRRPLPGHDGRVVTAEAIPDADLAALLAGAAAFCLPSHREGFGLSALEALACGAPAVVSDRDALPEVVGDAAIVASPSVDSVTDALRRVLCDERLAGDLRRRAVLRASAFDWDRTADGWLAALRRAAAFVP